jgi:hypothetical protein
MSIASSMTPGAQFPELAPGEAREIRQMFRSRAGLRTICDKFGVTREHVFALCGNNRGARHSQQQAKRQD